MLEIKNMIDAKDGTLPSYSWPGGYTLYYFCEDNSIVCPKCANKLFSAAKEWDFVWPSEKVIGAETHWEGPDLHCEECNATIESSYEV